jgi:CBS-domain-containing membrane protein
MKKRKKSIIEIIIGVLVVTLIISLLMTFQPVADLVAKPFNTAGILVKNVANTVFFTALGLLLVLLGIKALASPIVGVALIIIGLYMIYQAIRNSYPVGKKLENINPE